MDEVIDAADPGSRYTNRIPRHTAAAVLDCVMAVHVILVLLRWDFILQYQKF